MGLCCSSLYAEEVARRAAAMKPKRILEIAAGTGIVTEALAPRSAGC